MKTKLLLISLIIVVMTALASTQLEAARPATAESAAGIALASENNETGLFVVEKDSQWTPAEIETVEGIVRETVAALGSVGLDGEEMLDGYRFRRYAGTYVNDAEGLLAAVDHNIREITLSDSAFSRHHGFNIYHELGHIVDRALDRRLNQAFHLRAGSPPDGRDDWETAEGYWLRKHGREHAQEATADAFALWVAVDHAGLPKPVFYGTPLTTDYAGISQAIFSSLTSLSTAS